MIEIVPYVNLNGIWSIPEPDIKQVFEKIKSDGTLDIVFSSDKLNNSDEFLLVMQRPVNIPAFVFVDGKLSGFGWLNSIENNFAFAHFCFFKETWGKVSDAMGCKLLEYWFSFPDTNTGGDLLDVIIGRIPSFNEKAIRFAERIGFKRVGEIPLIEKNPSGDRASSTILYRLKNG